MKQIYKSAINIVAAVLFLLNTMHCSVSKSYHKINATRSADSIEYEIWDQGWVTKKTLIQEGDCILLLKERAHPIRLWGGDYVPPMSPISINEETRDDSFYMEPDFDSSVSRYSCDPAVIGRLWRLVDSVKGWPLEALIMRHGTELGGKSNYYFGRALKDTKDSVPFKKILDGLKRVKMQEYRFTDINKARASFRQLAFEPDVMHSDTDWLHGDHGIFYIQGDVADSIKRMYPYEAFYTYYRETIGATFVECDKTFYDILHLSTKEELQSWEMFIRPKRFSFVIYKKME